MLIGSALVFAIPARMVNSKKQAAMKVQSDTGGVRRPVVTAEI
jgi:hypothetical protein